jgi:cobalt-zinc-cadmium efflux system outer membrane protein
MPFLGATAFAVGLQLLGTPPQGTSPQSVPITVEQAVTEAIANNPDLKADRFDVVVAGAGVQAAGLWPNPTISFSADHLDLAGTPFTEENGAGPSEYSLRADWPFALPSVRKARRAAAAYAYDRAAGTSADRTRRLRLDVQDAFIDLMLTQRLVSLSRDNLDGMRKVAAMNDARVRAGDLAEVELMRTRVAVRQLENDADLADLARRNAARRLQALTGRPADGPPLEAVGDFAAGTSVADDSALVGRALAARGDLRAAEADVARAEADSRLQRSLGRPEFGLGAEFRRQDGVNGRGSSLGFFISAPLPLFDRNQGEVARADAEALQAAQRLRALRASVATEVKQALDRFTTARTLLERLERDQAGEARQLREIVGYAYTRGEASLIELLDAQRAFNDATRAWLAARAEFARAVYLVDAVSGEDRHP